MTRCEIPITSWRSLRLTALAIAITTSLGVSWSPPKAAAQAGTCATCTPLVPADARRCKELKGQLSKPAQFVWRGQAQLDKYEPVMAEFMEKLVLPGAWPRDATARDTGPYTATMANGQ